MRNGRTAGQAREHCVDELGLDESVLAAVPSLVLYYNYLEDLARAGFTNTAPLKLDCIFVHTIPVLDASGQSLCRPVLEITCDGELVEIPGRYASVKDEKHACFRPADEIMPFEGLHAVLYGDVVITCYHVHLVITSKRIDGAAGRHAVDLAKMSDRVPIVRICFHVGFLQGGGQMLRIKKADLDFAADAPDSVTLMRAQNTPMALQKDFKIDLIFSTVPKFPLPPCALPRALPLAAR